MAHDRKNSRENAGCYGNTDDTRGLIVHAETMAIGNGFSKGNTA